MTNIQFNDNRVEIKNIINEKCFNLLEGLSAEIESQVKKNTREDTGNTKRAWQHIVNETENSILDETDDDNDNDDNSILNKTDSSLNFTNDL